MRFFYLALVFSLCATFCHAQAAPDDATFLKQARAKYDAPFARNLQSFSCAVEFNWKQHFTEAVRLGDEGTDEEIATLIQPIRTRVVVSPHNAAVSSGMTDDEERRLVQDLADLFPESIHVNNAGLGGTADDAIWEYAKSHGFTFATKDKDFANLSIARGAPPKVILTQIGNCSTDELVKVIRGNAVRLSDFEDDTKRSLLILR